MTSIDSRYFVLFLIASLVSLKVFADESTKDNYYGSWVSGSSWVGGVSPGTTNLPTSAENYFVDGYIYVGTSAAPQSLTFKAGGEANYILIRDTLVIYGDMDFANKAMELRVASGGMLIIFGNFNATNKIDVSNGGTFVVKGNMNFSNSNQDVYVNNGGGLYVGGVVNGNATAEGVDLPLASLPPPIYNFVNGGGSTPLPVELTSFNARALEDAILVTWSTATELNNDYFTLEKSKNGVEFQKLTQVPGNGTTTISQEYFYSDSNPWLGLSYYRLSQTDYDGTTEVFKTIAVVFDGLKNSFAVYPNPVHDRNFTLQSSGWAKNESVVLNVYNISGGLVEKISLTSDTFGNIDEDIQLLISLEKSLYLFELSGLTKSARLKVIGE